MQRIGAGRGAFRCFLILTSAAGIAGAGCALDWATAPVDPADAAGGNDATSSDVDAGGDALEESSDVPDDGVDASDAGRSDADASDAQEADPLADASTCDPTHPCSDGGYCYYADHYCGSGQTSGKCAPVPMTCTDAAVTPVCACDTQVDLSSCASNKRGKDVSRQASCTAPVGEMRCGYRYCKTSNEACVQQGSTFTCISLGTCVTGCLCTGALLACSGGSCTDTGGVMIVCP